MGYTMLQWISDGAVLNAFVADLLTPVLVGVIVVCIAILSKGADWMIEGVVHLAERTGLPKIVIGATIVSLGTTMPEAFVSVMAAFMGNPGLALGNGVGSIIADTGLIFGLTCILATVPVHRYILDRTGWVQVGSAILLVCISLMSLATAGRGEPVLHRWVGVLFLILLAGYLAATYLWAQQANSQMAMTELAESLEDGEVELMGIGLCWSCLIGGLVMVVGAARVLVPSASQIAIRIGVPDDVIAATMVALGTSLPELMTAITAIRKGHPEITVGNIVGADVLNCLFVIGAAAVARPLAIPQNFFYFHFPAMLIVLFSFRAFISMNKGGVFRRWQGFWLLGTYAVYVIVQYALNIHIEGH
jgi:cation:H+ antiporter